MKKINFEGIIQKAVFDYSMISEGDSLAVGLSGGEDSQALLHALSIISCYHPQKFNLSAITIDMGFGKTDFSAATELCKSLGVDHHIVETKIGRIVFDERKEKNPCSLCANLRRGAINNKAKALGCKKVVLGHHRDDVIETMMMSLLYEGRFYCFSPVTYLSRKDLHVIRPMIYAKKSQIKEYCLGNSLGFVKNPCPASGHTNRTEVKKYIDKIEKANPDVREMLFGAVKRSKIDGWR